MSILYLAYDGMTDNLGQSQVIPYLTGLAAKGYSISLISCEKELLFEKRGSRVSALLGSAGIAWHPLPYKTFPPVISRFMNLRRICRKANELVRNDGSIQLVHCRSYMTALCGLNLKRSGRVKFLFDMRGFWADERIEGGLWSMHNPVHRMLYNYFKRKEAEFIKEADALISLTSTGKEEIINRFNPVNPDKIHVIPCCADTTLFSQSQIDAEELQRIKKELNLEGRFVLSYLGSTGTWYMLPEMMKFFASLRLYLPDAVFLFISPEPEHTFIQAALASGVDPNSIRVISAVREEVPALLAVSDLNIFFIRPVFSKKASSPTKLAEIMSLGIPYVTNSGIGDVDRITKETGAGYLVSDLSDSSFDQLIPELMNWLDQRKNSQPALPEAFTLAHGVDRYDAVYRGLLDSRDGTGS